MRIMIEKIHLQEKDSQKLAQARAKSRLGPRLFVCPKPENECLGKGMFSGHSLNGVRISPGPIVPPKHLLGPASSICEQEVDRLAERTIAPSSSCLIQREIDPAQPSDALQPDLTEDDVMRAIGYNRRRYGESSIRLIQGAVGVEASGVMDADTVRAVARFQGQSGIKSDGMVGPDTFDLIENELTSEGESTENCLTMLEIRGPMTPMDISVAGPGLANIFSRFDVEARFSPRCNCGEFQYRQFICGNVTRNGTSENSLFRDLPAGSLLPCPDWREDGDMRIPARYGHRDRPARAENRYLDNLGNVDQERGCIFQGFDRPGRYNANAVSGDRYNFDIRFYGDILRNGRAMPGVRRFWRLNDSVTIP